MTFCEIMADYYIWNKERVSLIYKCLKFVQKSFIFKREKS